MPPRAGRPRGRVGTRRPSVIGGVDPEIIFARRFSGRIRIVTQSAQRRQESIHRRDVIGPRLREHGIGRRTPGRRAGRRCGNGRGATAPWQRNGHGSRRRFACRRRAGGLAASGMAGCPRNRRWLAVHGGAAAGSARARSAARPPAPAARTRGSRARGPRRGRPAATASTQRPHEVVMAAGSEDEIFETAVFGRPERSCRLHSPAQHGGRIDRRGTELDQYAAAFPFGHARVSRSRQIEQTQNHVTHRHAQKSFRCGESATCAQSEHSSTLLGRCY